MEEYPEFKEVADRGSCQLISEEQVIVFLNDAMFCSLV